MRKSMQSLAVLALGALVFSSCMVVNPGEVAVKQRFGQLSDEVYNEGLVFYNPISTQIITTPTRTVNMEVSLSLPSKEGLNIKSQISILYRIEKNNVPTLIEEIGSNYENIISSVFRSASADICAQFMAKDMHSGKRSEIEADIAQVMNNYLQPRGIFIEAVLMKSIQLPGGLYNSIQSRLEAEQEVLRMEYIVKQEKLEAERKLVEAQGTRDAQLVLADGLTEEIIKLRSIEAFLELAQSNGAKIIITDGKAPFLVGDGMVE